jgi:hypothetical protein
VRPGGRAQGAPSAGCRSGRYFFSPEDEPLPDADGVELPPVELLPDVPLPVAPPLAEPLGELPVDELPLDAPPLDALPPEVDVDGEALPLVPLVRWVSTPSA